MEETTEGIMPDTPEAKSSARFVKGFSLSGEYVKSLEDKSFEIIKAEYKTFPKIGDPTQKEEKMVLEVKLSDGSTLDYLPNKTSQKMIINCGRGYELDAWIGFKGKLMTVNQKIGKDMKDVIYIESGA